jgi:hypothetical protein
MKKPQKSTKPAERKSTKNADGYENLVVEIRCDCGRGFSIRTGKEKKSNLCNKCLSMYHVHQSKSGAVTVRFTPIGAWTDQECPRERYSIVTEGE